MKARIAGVGVRCELGVYGRLGSVGGMRLASFRDVERAAAFFAVGGFDAAESGTGRGRRGCL